MAEKYLEGTVGTLDKKGGSMKLRAKVLLSLMLLLAFQASAVLAQEKFNIAELVLAVRKGIAEAQQRSEKEGLAPMFLIKEMELTISFVVEKSGSGEFTIKVLTLGGDIKHERTHTVTIRSETAALEHVKDRVNKCLKEQPNSTYPSCLRQAYKELDIPRIHR